MPGALDGIRVVEFGRLVAAPYCARLLADLGADCVKVERPGGDPARQRGPFPDDRPDDERSGLFLYLNSNKRGVLLDPEQDPEVLDGLLAAADVFVSDLQPIEAATLGLEAAMLSARFPRLIVTSVTPFGLTGPRADDRGGELVEWAAGGYAHLTPAGGKRDGGRPLKTAGYQAGFMSGASAAAGTMAALIWRESSGRGQVVDVSIQETLVVANDSTFARFLTHGDNVPTRLVDSSFEFMPCKDGYVSLLFVREDQWDRMIELMGNPDWAATDFLGSFASRRANWDAVGAMLTEYFMQYTREELYRNAQAHRVPLAPVNSAADVVNSPHLRARNYFVALPIPGDGAVTAPGAPFKLAATPWSLRRPAPRLGEHTAEVLKEIGDGTPSSSNPPEGIP